MLQSTHSLGNFVWEYFVVKDIHVKSFFRGLLGPMKIPRNVIYCPLNKCCGLCESATQLIVVTGSLVFGEKFVVLKVMHFALDFCMTN